MRNIPHCNFVHLCLSLMLAACLVAEAHSEVEVSWQDLAVVGLQHQLQAQAFVSNPVVSNELIPFYRQREFQPLWLTSTGLQTQAYDLFRTLRAADEQGLNPEDYYIDELRARWTAQTLPQQLELDIWLSLALLRYARDLVNGRLDPRKVDPEWHILPQPLDVQALLQRVAVSPSILTMLDDMEPSQPGYRRLREQLRRYQQIAATGGWPQVPEGPILRVGDSSAAVLPIRQRLRKTGDLVPGPTGDKEAFDSVLAGAVMRFQARHGLDIDGHVGPQTRAAMNVPVSQRIHQILINLERRRWLPQQLGERYLLVNMTGFELYANEGEQTVLAMPIIIGKAYRATPTFQSRLSYMEINPFWTVPKKIVLEDLIPVQLNNPNYFKDRKIRIFDGWGDNANELDPGSVRLDKLTKNYFPYRFRQDPGPHNSLGRIKFMFPNPYDIYLHDTPQRYLFNRRQRMYSSGCIRVADPLKLAAYLLGSPTQQQEEKLLGLIYRDERKVINLQRPLPIYLLYQTAWADTLDRMHFRDDIYQRDRALLQTAAFSP